jgi:hypothetical protein
MIENQIDKIAEQHRDADVDASFDEAVTKASDLRKRPLFSCTNCCEDYSWPAEDLRVHGEELWCEACWDSCHYYDTSTPVYNDLPPFVPAETEQIAKLKAENKVLREALKTAKDLAEYWINRTDTCGMGKTDYELWLATGHQSASMAKINEALLEHGK